MHTHSANHDSGGRLAVACPAPGSKEEVAQKKFGYIRRRTAWRLNEAIRPALPGRRPRRSGSYVGRGEPAASLNSPATRGVGGSPIHFERVNPAARVPLLEIIRPTRSESYRVSVFRSRSPPRTAKMPSARTESKENSWPVHPGGTAILARTVYL